MLQKSDLINYFYSNFTDPEYKGIGTEHEKFLFKKSDFKRLGYEDLNGIKTILNKIAEEEDWEKINEGNNLIGLKHKSGSSISLEPGGQFELSGAPLRNLHIDM